MGTHVWKTKSWQTTQKVCGPLLENTKLEKRTLMKEMEIETNGEALLISSYECAQ